MNDALKKENELDLQSLTLYSIFSRTLIENLPVKDRNMPDVRKIYKALMKGEMKAYRRDKDEYNLLFQLSRAIWDKNKSVYPNTKIAAELILIELHALKKIKFAKYFKLKERPYHKLYLANCNTNTAEIERDTYNLLESLLNITNKELELINN